MSSKKFKTCGYFTRIFQYYQVNAVLKIPKYGVETMGLFMQINSPRGSSPVAIGVGHNRGNHGYLMSPENSHYTYDACSLTVGYILMSQI